jgi:hypothetical protein
MGNYFTVFFFFVQPEIFLLQREKERKEKSPQNAAYVFGFTFVFFFQHFFLCVHT